MKILLNETLHKLGKLGDIVKVSPGYARNFLLPKKKAVIASEKHIEEFKLREEELRKQEEKRKTDALETAKSISGKHIVVVANASFNEGKLFGSINQNEIAKRISDIAKCEIKKADIVFKINSIRYTGVYEISIVLYTDVVAKMLLVVTSAENEVKSMLEKYQSSLKQE